MNFKETLLNKLENSNLKLFTLEDVLKLLGFRSGFDKRAVEATLHELVKEDKLVAAKRGKYMFPDYSAAIRGKVLMNRSGNAFVRPDAGGADIFVPIKNLKGACNYDTVLVKITRSISKTKAKTKARFTPRSFGKEEAEVIKIVERGYSVLVGLFSCVNGTNLVYPDDAKFADSIFIDAGSTLGAKDGYKVMVEITDYPTRSTMARGKVVEVLGDAKSYKVSSLSIIRSYGLIEAFSDAAISVAEAINKKGIISSDLENRKDYRKDMVVTIDGEDAKDFDDAISVQKLDNGYKLFVHIADVSHYVEEDSVLDREAYSRGTSVYFPDLVIPMLPTQLSNGICSLNPGEDRLTLSVEIVFDENANILSHKINKGVIRSSARLTYTQVEQMINGNNNVISQYTKEWKMLAVALELAKRLITRRDNAGELDFDLPEPQIDVDVNGKTINVRRKPRGLSDRLIEQFMVVTNEVVAFEFDKMKVPFVYRVHETPTIEKVRAFKSFASNFGLVLHDSNGVTPKEFQRVLYNAKGQTFFTAVSKVMLRSMQKAKYSPENLGHFGLALKNYCHFTSPIRRYPDLFIHRVISLIIENKMTNQKLNELAYKAEKASEQSSITERVAEDAERDVDELKKAEFMADKIGEEYDAVVSGAFDGGLFVELDNTVEGMIDKINLPPDNYIYDETKFSLIGKNNYYKIGDKLHVKLESVDTFSRKINFILA